GEEMLFRGVFQAVFSRWTHPHAWIAIALASILFGLLHAITITYALLATAMGVFLGWLWMLSDNLLTVVITHGLYDFLALVYLLRIHKGPQTVGFTNADPKEGDEDQAS